MTLYYILSYHINELRCFSVLERFRTLPRGAEVSEGSAGDEEVDQVCCPTEKFSIAAG